MSRPYRAIVFDFFGVLCSEVAPFWLAEHFTSGEAINIKASVVGAADRGELSQNEMFSELSRLTSLPPERIHSDWLSYAQVDLGMVDRVRALKGQFQLGLLTNSPAPFVREIMAEHHLGELFEAIVVSSELGVAKPEPAIYRAILSALAVSAGEALLVDDNPANVAGAMAVGMGGLLFHSGAELDAALERHR